MATDAQICTLLQQGIVQCAMLRGFRQNAANAFLAVIKDKLEVGSGMGKGHKTFKDQRGMLKRFCLCESADFAHLRICNIVCKEQGRSQHKKETIVHILQHAASMPKMISKR